MFDYNKLPKDVLSIIKPPIWDSYYYVSILTRKAYEKKIPEILANKLYNILDYGCGSRPYEYLFQNSVNKYVGVDIGKNPKADLEIVPGQKLPYEDKYFDIILSSQVLEHVEDVNMYMNECSRLLTNDGYLLLSTHGTWQYHAAPFDFQRWTSLGLKRLISSYNFKIIETVPVLGQLAVTSQLRLSFFDSFANMIGFIGKLILAPVSIIYQIKMMFEDLITPKRVKERDSAVYLVIAKKM